MKRLLSLSALPLLLAAQQGGVGIVPRTGPEAPVAVQPAAPKPGEPGAIKGQVLNATTGEPVKKANLLLRRADVTRCRLQQAIAPPPTIAERSP